MPIYTDLHCKDIHRRNALSFCDILCLPYSITTSCCIQLIDIEQRMLDHKQNIVDIKAPPYAVSYHFNYECAPLFWWF